MAKIELAQFDMQQAIAMSPVDSGFIGFAAKNDGLYIKKYGEPEIKILTESDIGSSVQTLTINQLSDLDRTDLDDNYYLVKGFFDGQLFQVTNGNIISQTIVTKDDILHRDIDFTETPVSPIVKSFAILDIYDNGTKRQLDTVTSEHLESIIDSSYVLTRIYNGSQQASEEIGIYGFINGIDTVVLESSISAYQSFAENLEFTKAGESIINATYGTFETILVASSGSVESVNSITPDENGNVVLKSSDIENDSNYVSDSSYVHTDNNYTTTEKNKLANQSGANSGDETTSTILTKIGDGNKISGNYLPSYVDDVIEGVYINPTTFQIGGSTITPEDGKIYISTDSNVTYRWSGSVYVSIGSSLALGETSLTAYRGDRGKIAYDHSQISGNPHGTAASDITTDSTHRFVTDSEKTTWSNKQDALVSGMNIKTINGTSVLGGGDISITGGGAGSDTTAIHTSISSEINSITEKVNLVDNDIVLAESSESSFIKAKIKLSSIKSYLSTTFNKLYSLVTDTGDRHGFVYPTVSSLSFNDSTYVFTLSASTGYDIYVNGTKYNVTTDKTVSITNTKGQWFIYYTIVSGTPTLNASQTV